MEVEMIVRRSKFRDDSYADGKKGGERTRNIVREDNSHNFEGIGEAVKWLVLGVLIYFGFEYFKQFVPSNDGGTQGGGDNLDPQGSGVEPDIPADRKVVCDARASKILEVFKADEQITIELTNLNKQLSDLSMKEVQYVNWRFGTQKVSWTLKTFKGTLQDWVGYLFSLTPPFFDLDIYMSERNKLKTNMLKGGFVV